MLEAWSSSMTMGPFVGIVTDRDLVERAMADRRDLDTPVAKVMTENVLWIREDSPVFAARA